MARLPHDWMAAVARDVGVESLRAFHIADDFRTGTAGEDVARERDHQLVAPHDPAILVDDSDPIGVTIVSDSDLRSFVSHGANQVAHICLDCRIGMMMRKTAVHLEVEPLHIEPELPHQRRGDRSTASVTAIEHDLESALKPELPAQVVVIIGNDRPLGDRSLAARGYEILCLD